MHYTANIFTVCIALHWSEFWGLKRDGGISLRGGGAAWEKMPPSPCPALHSGTSWNILYYSLNSMKYVNEKMPPSLPLHSGTSWNIFEVNVNETMPPSPYSFSAIWDISCMDLLGIQRHEVHGWNMSIAIAVDEISDVLPQRMFAKANGNGVQWLTV